MKTLTHWVDRWRTLRLRQITFDAQTRRDIQSAAEQYQIPSALIASILADERVRLDLADRVQEKVLRLSLKLPTGVAGPLVAAVERVCGRPVDTFSLGRAQMKTTTLNRLGETGYLNLPQTSLERRQLLLNDLQAPTLVAACLRATADHWQAGGVNIEGRPDVLGTLYSIGLTGTQGVHAHPQANARGRAIAAHAAWFTESTTHVPRTIPLPLT